MKEFYIYPFVTNKYHQWYKNIIHKAIIATRIYDSNIHELHHILPHAFGGSNDITNIVTLTFKEHYICHLLLTKFTFGKDKHKMSFALHAFFHLDETRNLNILRGRLYQTHKEYFIEACKERIPWTKTEIYKFKHIDSNEEFIGTRSEFRLHSGLTSQEVYNLIISPISRHAKRWAIFRENLQEFSHERRVVCTILSKPKTCPHCNRTVNGGGNYHRYHGDNCKLINPKQYAKTTEGITNLQKIRNKISKEDRVF